MQQFVTDIEFLLSKLTANPSFCNKLNALKANILELDTLSRQSPDKELIRLVNQKISAAVAVAKKMVDKGELVILKGVSSKLDEALQISALLKEGSKLHQDVLREMNKNKDADREQAYKKFLKAQKAFLEKIRKAQLLEVEDFRNRNAQLAKLKANTPAAAARNTTAAPTAAPAPAQDKKDAHKDRPMSKISQLVSAIFEALLTLLLSFVEGLKNNPSGLAGLFGGMFGNTPVAPHAVPAAKGPIAQPAAAPKAEPIVVPTGQPTVTPQFDAAKLPALMAAQQAPADAPNPAAGQKPNL